MNNDVDVSEQPYELRVGRFIDEVCSVAAANKVIAEFAPRLNCLGQTIAVELTDLFAESPGQGAGSTVMRSIQAQADLEQISVHVFPGGERNREFYARFEFEGCKQGGLVRYAPIPAWMLDD